MKRLIPLLLAASFLAGCTSYYRVTDLRSNRVYFTKSISHKKSGAAIFKDAQSKETVTILEHSEKKISKAEYQKNIATPVTTKPGW
ncbi:MAG: hypothetical protein ACYTGZ_11390 [Planctomycetota bacterium]